MYSLKNEANDIEVSKASLTWDYESKPTLTNLSFEIRRQKLVAVVGNVGSGKSSLLSAILGEMEKINGIISRQGSVSYVSQQAWIQNLTLRDHP